MPAYRSHKYVAGSTSSNLYKSRFKCPHPSCERAPALACASTYARHWRSAHNKERPWSCTYSQDCDFSTTRKTLLEQHYASAHHFRAKFNKRPRGSLTKVPPPIEVYFDENEKEVGVAPPRPDRCWQQPQREPSPSYTAAMLATLPLPARQMPAGRRPSLTVQTAPMTPMSLPALPSLNHMTPPPALYYPAQPPQMQMHYASAGPYAHPHYAGPMGSVPYPPNTVYSAHAHTHAHAPATASASATAWDSAAPWTVWPTPTSSPPKPLSHIYPHSHWDSSSPSSQGSQGTPVPEHTDSSGETMVGDADLTSLFHDLQALSGKYEV